MQHFAGKWVQFIEMLWAKIKGQMVECCSSPVAVT